MIKVLKLNVHVLLYVVVFLRLSKGKDDSGAVRIYCVWVIVSLGRSLNVPEGRRRFNSLIANDDRKCDRMWSLHYINFNLSSFV